MKATPLVHALTAAEAFIAGFEDDQSQKGVPALLRDVRGELSAAIGSEEFNLIEQHGQTLARCPLCAGKAEMWERTGGLRDTVKTVACSVSEDLGPLGRGCPLYMPPEDFYRATYKEAANTWNAAAATCAAAREAAQ